MEQKLIKILKGYQEFRNKYVDGDQSIMQYLADYGQQPQIMIVSCCDSRVDPALILQCNPGDLFVIRNVANIVPPYEKDSSCHGTSAALEFGICSLNIKHLILLGHSQCGGIQALLNSNNFDQQNDFINNWVAVIKPKDFNFRYSGNSHTDHYAKLALQQSWQNCMTFPWIKQRIIQKKLTIHLWFFDIKAGQIFTYSELKQIYEPLEPKNLAMTVF